MFLFDGFALWGVRGKKVGILKDVSCTILPSLSQQKSTNYWNIKNKSTQKPLEKNFWKLTACLWRLKFEITTLPPILVLLAEILHHLRYLKCIDYIYHPANRGINYHPQPVGPIGPFRNEFLATEMPTKEQDDVYENTVNSVATAAKALANSLSTGQGLEVKFSVLLNSQAKDCLWISEALRIPSISYLCDTKNWTWLHPWLWRLPNNLEAFLGKCNRRVNGERRSLWIVRADIFKHVN